MDAGRQQGAIRIGGGSAFFNDRLDAAVDLVENGAIDVLMIETLAERTIAMLQSARREGGAGYWTQMSERLEQLLPALARKGTRLVGNFGGADPAGAARMVREVAARHGLDPKVAAVEGDDVLALVRELDPVLQETGAPLSAIREEALSGNAYLGADAIAEAYEAGCDVIVTGRVTDSALALGPVRSHFNWRPDDYDAMACGILAGHLLECGGQATGGYFAEPGMKPVADADRIGFPIAEIRADRSIVLTKPAGSGGRLDRHTVIEQILYEMHDPGSYLTPDAILDVTRLDLAETAPDEVTLTGIIGRAPPETLKVLIGVAGGYLAEAEISYGGIGAVARAAMAREVLQARLGRVLGADAQLRFDLIGADSLWPRKPAGDIRDLRLRVAGRVGSASEARQILTEVDALYVNGPAGGGGVRTAMRPTIRTLTAFVPRDLVRATWTEIGGDGK